MHASRRVRSAWRARLSHELGHPRLWIAVRVVAGLWLFALAAVLYAYDVGGWWRALLLPAGGLHLYWAFLLYREGPGRGPT